MFIAGLNKESQKKFDQCIPLSVKIICLDSKVVNEIQERDQERPLASIEGSQNARKKKFIPLNVRIELHDFKIHPNAIQEYVEKNNLKVKL